MTEVTISSSRRDLNIGAYKTVVEVYINFQQQFNSTTSLSLDC